VNLQGATVVLRVRTVADILDLAFRYCFTNQRVYWRLAAVTLLPCFALCAYLVHHGWRWSQVWCLAVALGVFVQGPFTLCAGQHLFERDATAGRALREFVRHVMSYFLAVSLGCLLLALAYLPLLALIPTTWIRVAYIREVVLLEGASAGQALVRASRFIRRQGGPTLGMLCCLLLGQLYAVAGAELLGQGIVEYVFQFGQPFGSLWHSGGSLFALAGFFLCQPYIATARFLKYIDVRTRKEGWDVQLAFGAAAAGDEPGSGKAA
jgi:hypothetical protein